MAFGNLLTLSLLLTMSWAYVDARFLPTSDVKVIEVGYEDPRTEFKIPQGLERNEQLCTLCEEYTALATDYLSDNQTESEIMGKLSQACSELHSFEPQCDILVDYYGKLFFKLIGKIQPDQFCQKVNLCEKISMRKKEDTCTLCHRVVDEVLTKLKDPESQMEIIQILMKECNRMEQYTKECKRLVFRYGPLILANGEKFLESTDICSSLHACSAKNEAVASKIPAFPDEVLASDA